MSDYSLYSNKQTDFLQQRAFFGTDKNTQRFDVMKYPWYDKNNNKQQGNDWNWDEVTIKNDISDHELNLEDSQRFVTRKGLQRAIFLDSLNGRGPAFMFAQVSNLPEMEAAITTWNHFEVNKHSRTYTKHLRAFYKDPAEVFDESFTDPELVKIADSISSVYNKCYKSVIKWIYYNQNDLTLTPEEIEEIESDFIMAWVEVNILEGIRFYPFFSSIWAIEHTTGYMQELKEDLIFICRDENEHLNLTQHTLKLFKRNEDEGFSETFKKLIPRIKERYYQAYREECDWADYLFSKGSYLGMNATIMKQYMNYLVVRRMLAIGLTPDANQLGGSIVTVNPIKWVEDYVVNDEEEKLPQKENVLNYVTNAIDDDIADVEDVVSKISKLFRRK